MSEWLVQLTGEKFDLEELPKKFTSEKLIVIEKDGKYYLKSSGFNSLINNSEVQKKAKELLELINGAVKIKMPNYRLVNIDAVVEIDEEGQHHRHTTLKAEPISVRVKTSARVEITKPGLSYEEQEGNKTTWEETWVTLAEKYEEVKKVLRFFTKELSWDNLYEIWEVIEEDQGSKVFKKGWASEKKVERFTQTANSEGAIGDEARHALKRFRPPKKPMKLSEAESLIRTIADSWLSEKLTSLG